MEGKQFPLPSYAYAAIQEKFKSDDELVNYLSKKLKYTDNVGNKHFIKEVPLPAILTTNILKLFPLSSCQYVSTIPEKKNCMLPTFEKSTFCKGLCRENDGPSI